MTTPTFSVIGDLYSPTQLQRALVEASQIANALHDQLWSAGITIGYGLEAATGRLQSAAEDAAVEHAMSMKRTAPKDVSGG